jgi:predicted transcriptional regulator
MNLETRKINIISWVSHLQDESILSRIEEIQSQKEDWWDLISNEEKAEIEEGMQQADRGELKSTDEVLSKYKKWL